MSDLPERVQAYVQNGVVTLTEPRGDHCGVVLVPEQLALDAERELSNMAYEYNMLSSQSAREINALRAERDALQADLKALLPLAKDALVRYDDWCERHDEMPDERYEPARAIIRRENANN